MANFKEHQVVHIKGCIIHCYDNKEQTYEVELIDVEGKSHLITLSKDKMSEIIADENKNNCTKIAV